MDHQALFTSDLLDSNGVANRRQSQRPRPRSTSKATFYTQEEEIFEKSNSNVRLLQTRHLMVSGIPRPGFSSEVLTLKNGGRLSVVVTDSVLTTREVVDGTSKLEIENQPRLRLIISPPREVKKDESGRLARYNPEVANPFDQKVFRRLVDALHFHKACLRPWELGQVSTIIDSQNVFSLYLETYSYRSGWYKLSLSYDPRTMVTSTFLHNLSASDIKSVTTKLHSEPIQPLTIHPMLLPALVIELLFNICTKDLGRLFAHAINTQQTMGLNSSRRFEHFKNEQADAQAAATRSFDDGQQLAGLEERMEFSMMAGRKLLACFEQLDAVTPVSDHKARFSEAGEIIKNRLEFLIDGLEFQMPRLRRAKAHTELNQTGLENRTASEANKISQQIALESKADSTAMKAIAVLTMFFLPATFVAAFFAMPLFDWSAARGSDVVNSRFWIYWVVTVPGTLVVLALWRAWWVFDSWKQAREAEILAGGDTRRGGGGIWTAVLGWPGVRWRDRKGLPTVVQNEPSRRPVQT